MDLEDDTRPIINSIIEMAHNLGIAVTAEGIESRQTMAKLAGTQCDYAQGYYVSRPMSADDTVVWLADNVSKSARAPQNTRSEEHTSELQSLMRISYAVFCLKKKKEQTNQKINKAKKT